MTTESKDESNISEGTGNLENNALESEDTGLEPKQSADASGEPTSSGAATSSSAGASSGAVSSSSAARTSGGTGLGGPMVGYLGGIIVILSSIGWLVHAEQNRPSVTESEEKAAEVAAAKAKAAPSGPCAQWQAKLCESAGANSATCSQAAGAAELLSDASCRTELRNIEQTVARVQQSRQDCTTLMSRLCSDLGDGSKACQLVKDKTPTFPTAQCAKMLSQYDDVLGELTRMESGGAPPARRRPPVSPGAHGAARSVHPGPVKAEPVNHSGGNP